MTEWLDIPRFLRTKYKDEYMTKDEINLLQVLEAEVKNNASCFWRKNNEYVY